MRCIQEALRKRFQELDAELEQFLGEEALARTGGAGGRISTKQPKVNFRIRIAA